MPMPTNPNTPPGAGGAAAPSARAGASPASMPATTIAASAVTVSAVKTSCSRLVGCVPAMFRAVSATTASAACRAAP